MTEDQKKLAHPIIERALKLAYKGVIDTIEFDNYAVEQLQDKLKDYFGKQELVDAVKELVNLACFLDVKMKCHSASMKILEVVASTTEEIKTLVNKKETKEYE